MNTLLRGAVAGAAGTMALDLTTYLDMLVRGRAASQVPADTAQRMTGALGLELGADTEAASNRTQALGALMGYVAGMGTATVYAFASQRFPHASKATRIAALALLATAAGNVPAVATGATDPREWDAVGWISDIVPHLIYGAVTVGVYERLPAPRTGLFSRRSQRPSG